MSDNHTPLGDIHMIIPLTTSWPRFGGFQNYMLRQWGAYEERFEDAPNFNMWLVARIGAYNCTRQFKD